MFNEFQQVWGERRKFHVFVKLLGMVTSYEEGLNIEKGKRCCEWIYKYGKLFNCGFNCRAWNVSFIHSF